MSRQSEPPKCQQREKLSVNELKNSSTTDIPRMGYSTPVAPLGRRSAPTRWQRAKGYGTSEPSQVTALEIPNMGYCSGRQPVLHPLFLSLYTRLFSRLQEGKISYLLLHNSCLAELFLVPFPFGEGVPFIHQE
jgi:hypothetical protein